MRAETRTEADMRAETETRAETDPRAETETRAETRADTAPRVLKDAKNPARWASGQVAGLVVGLEVLQHLYAMARMQHDEVQTQRGSSRSR